ncbi:MAG: hypothetical protein KBA55_12055, partial [Ruminococcus sp.]|nr:hypothetical protein [Ruminococcus sp.]
MSFFIHNYGVRFADGYEMVYTNVLTDICITPRTAKGGPYKLTTLIMFGRTLKHLSLTIKKEKSDRRVREKGLREKRVQRGKPTGKRREGGCRILLRFSFSPLS